MSLTCNSLDPSRFCYHIFVISKTLWLSCQQSYRLKYVKSHNPQVFYPHCRPKLRNCQDTSHSMFGLTASHLFIWRKDGSWINYLIGTGSPPLGTYRLIRTQQALNKDLSSHEDGGCLCSDHAQSEHLLWHRKRLVWGEQSFPNLEGMIQL